uniref:Putative secreted protein n=1 Tax=Anopheles darlingi TaxID=43151 RepID=A0A2M4DBR7_ANODA
MSFSDVKRAARRCAAFLHFLCASSSQFNRIPLSGTRIAYTKVENILERYDRIVQNERMCPKLNTGPQVKARTT